jgi:cytochrome b subunit of formate dehydrogenase
MARGIFTGFVRLDYAKHRHPLWYDRIKNSMEKQDSATTVVKCGQKENKRSKKRRG